ncbi:GNAT family N-acetyltransferase [Sphingobacterium chuzhouense]|uniref:GNAT family N-acetyltransferase n=1 Tax=Sphingobacterium chuzhouense TaxID=1742264 RepID=A0ABR7XQN8_9SPHI|nr:GNAT family N-acetyltransferase [Sphingobacterium chuzhouense]MBD1421463.1 GNAT family N-acetyltransferase [Sphingobacterium chuzhouense]
MTTKIRLEKLTAADFPVYFNLVGDEDVMAMITERVIPLEEAKSDYEKRMLENQFHSDFGHFKIMEEKSDNFIGVGKLEIEAPDSDRAELGYMLLPKYWGKGIAGEVARQLIEVARKHGFITKLFAIIDPKNIPSRKILINNGFVSKEFADFDGLPGEVLELVIRN